jgi:tetratricopeptide (TPR) repeat protein
MRYIIFLMLVMAMGGLSAFARADTVYLNSGEKVEGAIFREGGINVYMVSDTEVGLVSRAVPQNDVEKIEYEQNPEEDKSEDGLDEIVKRYREFKGAFRTANKAFQKKEYYDAMQGYRRAQELNPKFPTVHYNLGVVYTNLGYSTRAKKCFQDAGRLAKLIRNPSEKEQELIANIEKALQALQ